jgi:preprotein translocase subunit SecE
VKTGTLENVKAPSRRDSSETGGLVGKPLHWWQRARTFLTEVRNETKRVTWPSRSEVYATTIVVILVSVFFGVYLWLIDLGLDRLVHWIFGQFGVA